MGFFSSFKSEFIDIIEWLDDSNNTLVYRFERHDNEIKNGAKLTVREGQVAVFINEGKIADLFTPGLYQLTTENLPLLSTLKGWKYGFDSPFKAEVYFVNTRNFTAQKWGTRNPITLSDQRFGMLEIRAFGTYVLKVDKPETFIREIVGTDGHFTTDEIAEQLKSLIVTRFTDAVGEADLPVERYASNVNELSTAVSDIMQREFDEYGIKLTKFLVENISMPEEIKKEIFELSRLDRVDLDKLTKMKTAKAVEKAAENESGTAGAGMGMGMGFAMANQMGQAMSQQPAQPQSSPTPPSPPPLPTAVTYFIAIDGQQHGPYDIATLKQMVLDQTLTRETLVWKQGMAAWSAAGVIAEISAIFGAVPPPLPPQ